MQYGTLRLRDPDQVSFLTLGDSTMHQVFQTLMISYIKKLKTSFKLINKLQNVIYNDVVKKCNLKILCLTMFIEDQ